MKIVIDIDEDIAQGIIDGKNDVPRNIVRAFQATIADAIKNGTPLPKRHGRVIDESKITTCYMPVNKFDVRGIRTDAPTIIEDAKIVDERETIVKGSDNKDIKFQVLEQQPCDDYISREAAIQAIQDEYQEAKAEKASSGYLTGVAYLTGLANAAFLIHNLPSIKP